eukprot:SAG22_NODE_383_length_11344_cov_6.163895_6_plen_453_part_00
MSNCQCPFLAVPLQPAIRDIGRFWADRASGTESVVRVLLRDGWRLPAEQPEFLRPYQQQGIVGVQLNKAKHKPKFVCSLCGKAQASEGPFEKHLDAHVTRELWEDSYEQRQLYDGGHWQAEAAGGGGGMLSAAAAIGDSVIRPQLHAAAAAKAGADAALHKFEAAAQQAQTVFHANLGSQRCGHVAACGASEGPAAAATACPGSGCCISEMSIFDMVASVAKGAVQVAALKASVAAADDDPAAAAADLEFLALSNAFAASPECRDAATGCCHAVLEAVRAVKGASHTGAFSILSRAVAQVPGSASSDSGGGGNELQRAVLGALQEVSATRSRLELRCGLFELCMQLGFLRGFVARQADDAGVGGGDHGGVLDGPTATDAWAMELARRRACLEAVAVGCDARLLQFLLSHPQSQEQLEAAFGAEEAPAVHRCHCLALCVVCGPLPVLAVQLSV